MISYPYLKPAAKMRFANTPVTLCTRPLEVQENSNQARGLCLFDGCIMEKSFTQSWRQIDI
jgi:hypothetical protein